MISLLPGPAASIIRPMMLLRDFFTVLFNEDVAANVGGLDEKRGGPGVNAQLVHDGQLFVITPSSGGFFALIGLLRASLIAVAVLCHLNVPLLRRRARATFAR